MAGFEVTMYGRFWVITEANADQTDLETRIALWKEAHADILRQMLEPGKSRSVLQIVA